MALGIVVVQQRSGRQEKLLHLHIRRQGALRPVHGVGQIRIVPEQPLDHRSAKLRRQSRAQLRPDQRQRRIDRQLHRRVGLRNFVEGIGKPVRLAKAKGQGEAHILAHPFDHRPRAGFGGSVQHRNACLRIRGRPRHELAS